ncbi:MAG: hypothetical protein FWH38_10155, partial [Treponema sp.]|nr:hypothetical protein [Treponema sp.]
MKVKSVFAVPAMFVLFAFAFSALSLTGCDNGATDGGENEAPFVAVTDITGVAPIAEAGVPLA